MPGAHTALGGLSEPRGHACPGPQLGTARAAPVGRGTRGARGHAGAAPCALSSREEPNRAKLSQTEPCRAKPSRAEPCAPWGSGARARGAEERAPRKVQTGCEVLNICMRNANSNCPLYLSQPREMSYLFPCCFNKQEAGNPLTISWGLRINKARQYKICARVF